MERLLNKSSMSSELKASVLGTFLEDQAARVYHECAGTRDVSYEELTAHLKMEFGCRLSQYELGKRLDANKRAGDTWKDYITYLKFIERLMEGDRSQLLLETVCNNACPELRSTLLSKVDESRDGRRTGHNKQGGKGGQSRQQLSKGGGNNGQNGKQGAQQQQGNANSQAKAKKNSTQQQSDEKQAKNGQANTTARKFSCWNCGEEGHKVDNCPNPKKNSQKGKANQAKTLSNQGDDDDDANADLWMASAERSVKPPLQSSWLVDSGASHHMRSSGDVLFGTSPSDLVITVANGGVLRATIKGSCILRVCNDDGASVVLLHEVHFVPGLERNLLSVTELGEHGITSTFTKKLRFCLPCTETKQTRNPQPTEDTPESAPTDEVGAVLGVDLKVDMPPDRNDNKHMLTIVDYGSSYNRVYLLQSKKEAAKHLMDFIPEFQRQYNVTVKVVRSDGGGEFFGHEFNAFMKRHGIRQQSSLADNSASNGKVERMHRTIMNAGRAMLWASKLPERYWGDAARYASYIRNHAPTRANANHKAPLDVLKDGPPNVGHILRFGSRCTVHVAHKTGVSLKKRAEKGIIIGISDQQKGYRVFLPRTKKIVVSADVQNVDKLELSTTETQDILDQLHGEADSRNSSTEGSPSGVPVNEQSRTKASAPPDDNSPEREQAAPPDRTTRTGMVLCSNRKQKRKQKKNSGNSSESGEDEYAGHPISAAAIRRVFGSRKKLKTADFSLPNKLIADVARSATLLLTTGAVTPRNIAEAKKTPEWPEWKAAIEKELADIQANDTWEVVRVPAGEKTISSKWVFRIKFNSRGELERFKARLVARGFTQRYGIDFDETYSPVLKITSLRLLVALAAAWRKKLRQGDVPNAYVKAALDRPLLMKPPEGTTEDKDTAWLLLKSLYGLKQSGLLWNKEVNAFLLSLGFTRSKMDPCLYFRRRNAKLSLLGLYVDDVIIVSEEDADSDWAMQQLSMKFDIKDMGVANKCLGITIEHGEDGILLHQHDTIEGLLHDMGMAECKPVRTPGEHSKAFDDDSMMDQSTIMRKAIGSLLWISNCTRPDITAAVNYLARFVARPRQSHWQGVKRVLRYLKGTAAFGLLYKYGQGTGTKLQVTIYSDADWAGDSTDAKSVSGAALVINGMVIAWSSKKQTSVALSTMEAEYVAAAMAAKDAVWVKQLLVEVRLWTSKESVLLKVDNQSAIKSMVNEMSSSRSKHINIRYHFIRDVISQGDISVIYCPTQEQLADIFTKPLQRVVFERLRLQLRIVEVGLHLREAVGFDKS